MIIKKFASALLISSLVFGSSYSVNANNEVVLPDLPPVEEVPIVDYDQMCKDWWHWNTYIFPPIEPIFYEPILEPRNWDYFPIIHPEIGYPIYEVPIYIHEFDPNNCITDPEKEPKLPSTLTIDYFDEEDRTKKLRETTKTSLNFDSEFTVTVLEFPWYDFVSSEWDMSSNGKVPYNRDYVAKLYYKKHKANYEILYKTTEWVELNKISETNKEVWEVLNLEEKTFENFELIESPKDLNPSLVKWDNSFVFIYKEKEKVVEPPKDEKPTDPVDNPKNPIDENPVKPTEPTPTTPNNAWPWGYSPSTPKITNDPRVTVPNNPTNNEIDLPKTTMPVKPTEPVVIEKPIDVIPSVPEEVVFNDKITPTVPNTENKTSEKVVEKTNKKKLKLPNTGTASKVQVIKNKNVETDLIAEDFKKAGAKNTNLNFWTDNKMGNYIIIPSKGLVVPLWNQKTALDEKELEKAMTFSALSLDYLQAEARIIGWHSSYFKGKKYGKYKTHFQKIIGLEKNTEIWIYENGKRKIYTVNASYETKWADLEFTDEKDKIVLFTCTPIGGNSGRWIVEAKLKPEVKKTAKNTKITKSVR